MFGHLLKIVCGNDEILQLLDMLDLIILKNEEKLNLDIFFKRFVFGKMYYFAGDHLKSLKNFLDAIELH